MTTTTYYNLNIVEGTDIVNPLIVDNPNYQKIDETMHNNAVAAVTLATEIANATVHAITRENSDCAVIRFIATSQWKAGDTATVDGVPVTALLPSGETLPDGAYVINANVLCVLTGTNLTVYVGKSETDANEIAFNDTTVGAELVKLDGEIVRLDGEIVRLDGEIDNVNSNLNALKNPVLLFDIKSNTYNKGDLLGGRIDMSAYSGFIISYSTVYGGYYKTSIFVGDMKAEYQWLELTNNNGVHYYTGAQVRYNGLFIDSVGTNKLFIDKLYGIPA